MTEIENSLVQQGYHAIAFRIRKSNHLYVSAKINGVKGVFLLDTGASNTCIDLNQQSFFQLTSNHSNTKASGAGSNNLYTEISKDNRIQLGKWKRSNTTFILLDLNHVNVALSQYKLPTVHGIIGSDLLKRHEALIHYPSRLLFMR
ncbi:MAG TPA: retropepsin-like aspartic protease [Flavobacterium sp.]|nr:retropepsin-like aspartic protease [Flavobacterium sp.]